MILAMRVLFSRVVFGQPVNVDIKKLNAILIPFSFGISFHRVNEIFRDAKYNKNKKIKSLFF